MSYHTGTHLEHLDALREHDREHREDIEAATASALAAVEEGRDLAQGKSAASEPST